MIGLGLLFAHELGVSPVAKTAIWVGIGWSLLGVLFSSIANVMQAGKLARGIPVASLIAWGMAWGTAFDCIAAWAMDGAPVIDPQPVLLAGHALSRADRIGAGLHLLFHRDPRDRAGPRGLYQRAEPGAGDAAVDGVRELPLVDRGGGGRRCCRSPGCSWRCGPGSRPSRRDNRRSAASSRAGASPCRWRRAGSPHRSRAPSARARPRRAIARAADRGGAAGTPPRSPHSGWRAGRRRCCRRPPARARTTAISAADDVVDMDAAEDLAG